MARSLAPPADVLQHQTDADREQKFHLRSGKWTSLRRNFPSKDLALHRRHDLPGIEDVLRIECLFQRAHGVDRLSAEFGFQIFLLALPDAMLAGAGSIHRLRALDQPVHELL